MKKEKIVCLVATQYTLLLYLLYSSMQDIKDTYFIFTYGIHQDIAVHFPKSVFIKKDAFFHGKKIKQWLYCYYLRMFKLRFVGKKTQVYAQDHLNISPSLLYNRNYILLEDSPFIESVYRNSERYKTKERYKKQDNYKLVKWLYGKTFWCEFGNNDLCKGIVMSENEGYIDFLDGKKRYICPLQESWEKCSKEKKEYILSVFNLSETDIQELGQYKTILFTQPLYPDCLTEEEHRSVFSKILANYSIDNLIIKKHPRDVCDYSTIVPDVKVFSKNIPSQLLDLVGVKFELAITPFSSAVLDFSYPIQIDWYGTECHPKLLEIFGKIPPSGNARMRYVNS